MPTICANPDCKEPQPVMRARWVPEVGWLCLKCAPAQTLKNVSGAMFPYMTFGIGDGPKQVQVQSLRHLRKLEAKFGVQSVAFNQNENNFQDAPRRRNDGSQ
jgi:hypothetical protein